MTAIPTVGISVIADMFTKRGRQALVGRKPGVRHSPGLTGADRDEFITLRNKSNPTEADKKRIKELQDKGAAKIAQDKNDAEALKKAQDAAAATGASAGASSGSGSGGGGSSDAGATQAPAAASPMGSILLAAGLGALMLL